MTKKILIIDDEPDIRNYLMAALDDEGYTTFGVNESEPIPEAVIKYKPDLIILDIMMPQRAGISIYKELRVSTNLSNIPIALLSGMTYESDFNQTGLLQLLKKESIPLPNRFIDKPVNLNLLLSSIKSLFNERNSSHVTSK